MQHTGVTVTGEVEPCSNKEQTKAVPPRHNGKQYACIEPYVDIETRYVGVVKPT